MAANKRTRAQRENDLEKLSEFTLAGKSQTEMAQLLGISQSQVSQDLKKLDDRWQKALHNKGLHKAREIAKLNRLEMMLNEGWERSLKPKETKIAEKITGGKSERTKAVSRHEQRDGNPAYTTAILAVIDKRCKLLGLNPPKRLTIEKMEEFLDILPDDVASGIKECLAGTHECQGLPATLPAPGEQPSMGAEGENQPGGLSP
jgi:predicted transcriptional regulator